MLFAEFKPTQNQTEKAMPNLVACIKAFNQGRDPQLIQLKYKAMLC